MIVGPGYNNITLCTDKCLISKQMITTTITKPWKEKTDKIVPQIIKVTHAAMQNYFYKDIKCRYNLTAFGVLCDPDSYRDHKGAQSLLKWELTVLDNPADNIKVLSFL
jgi:hypothetical protein